MRNRLLGAFATLLMLPSQQNVRCAIISDFVPLGTATPISANNGANSSAAVLSDLNPAAGNGASQATVSRTFTDNATFGSFVIDFTIAASQSGVPADIGVDFGTSNGGIGVGTDRNISPPHQGLEFEISGIDLSSLNPGFSVLGYGFESVRIVAANAPNDAGGVTWDDGLTGGSLGNVVGQSAGFEDINDGLGIEEPFIFEDPPDNFGMYTWDFSQDDTNGSGAVTNRVYVENISNADSWWLNRINLLADVSAVPEPSTFVTLSGLLGVGAVFAWRRRRQSP